MPIVEFPYNIRQSLALKELWRFAYGHDNIRFVDADIEKALSNDSKYVMSIGCRHIGVDLSTWPYLDSTNYDYASGNGSMQNASNSLYHAYRFDAKFKTKRNVGTLRYDSTSCMSLPMTK